MKPVSCNIFGPRMLHDVGYKPCSHHLVPSFFVAFTLVVRIADGFFYPSEFCIKVYTPAKAI